MFPKATYFFVFCLVAFVVSQHNTCSYHDGKNQYNFSPLTLTNEDYKAVDENNQAYYFNICANTNTVICDPASPVCQSSSQSQLYSCGLLNTQTFNVIEGIATVTYTDGALCLSSGIPRTTTIFIECDQTATTPVVESINETIPCNYEIRMKSKYGCPAGSNSKCSYTTANGQYVDLGPLVRSPGEGDYSIRDQNGYLYFLNICANSTVCKNDAACQISPNLMVSLGEQTTETISGIQDGVSIKYTDGSICNNGMPRTSTVNILCDQFEEGRLVNVTETTACNYQFNMMSRHACY